MTGRVWDALDEAMWSDCGRVWGGRSFADLHKLVGALNDELKVQRCRLKVVRLREDIVSHHYDGVYITGPTHRVGIWWPERLLRSA